MGHRVLDGAVAVALGTLALTGCAASPPATCSFGGPVDVAADSMTSKTRVDLVDDLISDYEEALAALPARTAFHPEISLPNDPQKLEALISVLGDARDKVVALEAGGIAVDETVGVSGSDSQGRAGRFTIAYSATSKGYGVTDFEVTGIPDPEGYC